MEPHLVAVTIESLQFLDVPALGTNLTLHKAIMSIHHTDSPDWGLFLAVEKSLMRLGTHTFYAHPWFTDQVQPIAQALLPFLVHTHGPAIAALFHPEHIKQLEHIS